MVLVPLDISGCCFFESCLCGDFSALDCPGRDQGFGSRSVIGAGSVVIRDIPANVFAAGNPRRVICPVTRGSNLEQAQEARHESTKAKAIEGYNLLWMFGYLGY